MWIFNVILLLIFVTGYILSSFHRDDWMIGIDKREHKFYPLYPLANLILQLPGLHKLVINNTKINNAFKALHRNEKPEYIQKLYWCKRLSQFFIIIVLFNILSLFAFLYDISNPALINGKYLLRPEYGQGSNEVQLKVSFNQEENENFSFPKALPEEKEVSIDVEERRYTTDEVEKLFEEAFAYLDTRVLGNNKDFEQVIEDLNFASVIPGTSIEVKWIPQDQSLLQSSGAISNERIDSDGVTTSVTAVLQYNQYEKEKIFHFKILPKQYTEDELLSIALEEEIKSHAETSSEKELLELPDKIDHYILGWRSSGTNNELSLLLIGVVLAVLVWLLDDKELEKQMKIRKEQMLLDYPEIINKFTLLVNAGMTIKQAWSKITEDYHRVQNQKGMKRYAYEEMLITTFELKLGVPEAIAYEQFGRRTGLIPYMKFSSLISQNLKKGTRGFTEMLMYEAAQAFEQRKETAKRLGEEAGTKLLMPMMLLMVIVFLIIMIPAFMAFSI